MTLRKRWILVLGTAAVVLGLGAALWRRQFHSYTPAAALRDLQAAAEAHGKERPVERFLDARYGPMTEARNRQDALKDFFNIGHIEGLYLIVGRLNPVEKKADISALAQWIADYRFSMSTEEKAALGAYFRSATGRARVREATKSYLQKDAQFRAAAVPVIRELLTTVAATQEP